MNGSTFHFSNGTQNHAPGTGRSRGAPLMLHHGDTIDAPTHQPLLPDIAARAHMFALELPRHGRPHALSGWGLYSPTSSQGRGSTYATAGRHLAWLE